MNAQQLRRLRLARGFSLDALAQEMGGIVTKQALSKYEQGEAQPSPRVLIQLVKALGVRSADLMREASCQIELIAYRKRASLGKREQERIEAQVQEALQKRVRLQQILGINAHEQALPIQELAISTLEEAEDAADSLRQRWNVGQDPIANLTALLEEHMVHVIELEGDNEQSFDGLAALAHDQDQTLLASAVVSRTGIDGERQRLNLAHELGHVVLLPADDLDEEKAAFRFGAALLAPAQQVREQVGQHRSAIQLEELVLLKQHFGLSIQALLRRLRDLEIINEAYYKQWMIDISHAGWRKQEPETLPAEQSTWLRRSLLRALSEELISRDEAAQIGGTSFILAPSRYPSRRMLAQMPLEERRRMLAEQAAAVHDLYGPDEEREMWQGGDLVDE